VSSQAHFYYYSLSILSQSSNLRLNVFTALHRHLNGPNVFDLNLSLKLLRNHSGTSMLLLLLLLVLLLHLLLMLSHQTCRNTGDSLLLLLLPIRAGQSLWMLLRVRVVGMPEPVGSGPDERALPGSPVFQEIVSAGMTQQIVVAARRGHHDSSGVRVEMIGVQVVKTRAVLELNFSSVRLHEKRPHFAAKVLVMVLVMMVQQQALLFLLQILMMRLISGGRNDRCMMNEERHVFIAHRLDMFVVVVGGAVHLTGIDLPVDVTVRTDGSVDDLPVHWGQHWIQVDDRSLARFAVISEWIGIWNEIIFNWNNFIQDLDSFALLYYHSLPKVMLHYMSIFSVTKNVQ